MVAGPHAARAAEASEDLVGDEQRAGLVARLTQPLQDRRRVHAHPARALDEWLDHHGGDRLAVLPERHDDAIDRVLEGLGAAAVAEEQRREDLEVVVGGPHAHRAEGVPVIPAGERQESPPLGLPVLLEELKSDLQRDLDAGGSVIAEERARQPLGRGSAQALGELDGGRVDGARDRAMREGVRLLGQGADEAGVAMAEVVAPPRGAGVEEPCAARVGQPAPLGGDHVQGLPTLMSFAGRIGRPEVTPGAPDQVTHARLRPPRSRAAVGVPRS